MPSERSVRNLFFLEDGVAFLNHGSFGACPRPVFEEYQRIQLELERQPVRFLGREFRERMARARAALAGYLGADADDLVFVPNATTGLNVAARSLDLKPGDEILGTDHEYGALDRMWQFLCEKAGAKYVRAPISTPVQSRDRVVKEVWSHVTERTRAIFISHITSPTALVLPVKEVIAKAREAGIFTIIDGAHAPGQIPVDLQALGADVYSGNCHKWMLAPKGSAFLHVRREVQHLIAPLVVSWGWESDEPSNSRFVDWHEWQGTRDISAFLAVPAAVQFMRDHEWKSVRQACASLLRQYVPRVLEATGERALSPNTEEWIAQMVSFVIPTEDWQGLKTTLYDEFRIEVPTVRWNGQTLVRVSVNAHDSEEDLQRLIDALPRILGNAHLAPAE